MRAELGINAFQKPYFSRPATCRCTCCRRARWAAASATAPLDEGRGRRAWSANWPSRPATAIGSGTSSRWAARRNRPATWDSYAARCPKSGCPPTICPLAAVPRHRTGRAQHDPSARGPRRAVVFKSSPMGTSRTATSPTTPFCSGPTASSCCCAPATTTATATRTTAAGLEHALLEQHHVGGHDQAPARSSTTKGRIVDFQWRIHVDGRALGRSGAGAVASDDSATLAAENLTAQGQVLVQRYRADGSLAGTLRVKQQDVHGPPHDTRRSTVRPSPAAMSPQVLQSLFPKP